MMYNADKTDKSLAKNMSNGKKPKGDKDHKSAMKGVTSNLKKASKMHAKQSAQLAKASKTHAADAEKLGKLTNRMKRTKNPGYKMDDY